MWLSLEQGTEPGREVFVEVFGAATTSGKSGNIGSNLVILFEFAKHTLVVVCQLVV